MVDTSVYRIAIVLALNVSALVVMARYVVRVSSGASAVWERQIRRFEKADRLSFPRAGGIVFTGSSTIRLWASLHDDMAPRPTLNRGFGGAQIHQVTHFSDRMLVPYRPEAIVFYAGENDIAGVMFSKRKTADEVRDAYRTFCQKIHSQLPEVSIYFISIKPPKARLKSWPEMQRANTLIREFCGSDHRLHYIDVVPAMLDAEGKPRRDVFKWDGIHLNDKGYAIWASIVKPILEQHWMAPKQSSI